MFQSVEQSVEMWLWLLLVMQPHNPRTAEVLKSANYDIKRACINVRDGQLPFINARERRRAMDIRQREVREVIKQCEENGIAVVTFDSESYPPQLRQIENPPIVLFVQGNIRCIQQRIIVSAVGTRNPSDYSLSAADVLCGQLASEGAAIVSGLAVGLDTAAHRSALKANGITVGILACGNLVNYPAESCELKKEIIAKGGAVISELLPETAVPRGYFNTRNRLISGLAHAVVVLEAAERSGALLTANHAFEQRRRVFFIPPHDIADSRYSGASKLYREGASPIFSSADITKSLKLTADRINTAPAVKQNAVPPKNTANQPTNQQRQVPQISRNIPQNEYDIWEVQEYYIHLCHVLKFPNYIEFGKVWEMYKPTAKQSRPAVKQAPPNLSDSERKLYQALMEAPLTPDSLIAKTGLGYSEITQSLMMLELGGTVERKPDGRYAVV